jgi:hypothetical protein
LISEATFIIFFQNTVLMKNIYSNVAKSEISDFSPNQLNTSCTGGTVSDITVVVPEDSSGNFSYILSLKELNSFPGFETVAGEEAQTIIDSMVKLSTLAYKINYNA